MSLKRMDAVLLAGLVLTAYGFSLTHPAPLEKTADQPKPAMKGDSAGYRTPPQAAPAVAEAAASVPPVAVAAPVSGIPGIALAAYRKAADRAAASCHLPWQLLAAIGKVESNHAEGGAVDANGTALRPILGPELNGSNGFAAIPNTDGALDGGSAWARAVGPMQFIPSTWHNWGVDATGDGHADPENLFDATASAADYLCAGGRDVSTPDGLEAAVLSYNNSPAYFATVSQWYAAYLSGVVPIDDGTTREIAVIQPQNPITPATPPKPAPPPKSAQPAPPPPSAPAPPQPDPLKPVTSVLTTTVNIAVSALNSIME